MFLNIVIGTPIVEVSELLANDKQDYVNNEKDQTLFTNNRFLPAVLKEANIVPSIGEVKRNRPELVRTLNKLDCFWLKWGKKKLYIIVGE